MFVHFWVFSFPCFQFFLPIFGSIMFSKLPIMFFVTHIFLALPECELALCLNFSPRGFRGSTFNSPCIHAPPPRQPAPAVAFRFCAGVGVGISSSEVNKYIGELVPSHRRGFFGGAPCLSHPVASVSAAWAGPGSCLPPGAGPWHAWPALPFRIVTVEGHAMAAALRQRPLCAGVAPLAVTSGILSSYLFEQGHLASGIFSVRGPFFWVDASLPCPTLPV